MPCRFECRELMKTLVSCCTITACLAFRATNMELSTLLFSFQTKLSKSIGGVQFQFIFVQHSILRPFSSTIAARLLKPISEQRKQALGGYERKNTKIFPTFFFFFVNWCQIQLQTATTSSLCPLTKWSLCLRWKIIMDSESPQNMK